MASNRPLPSSFIALPTPAKVGILIAICLLLGCGYYFAAFVGLQQDLEQAERQHALLAEKLGEAQRRQRTYLQLREDLTNRKSLERHIQRILPETAEMPAFLDDLNRLAELSGLQMGNVVPQPEAPDKLFVKVPVALKIDGEYHQFAKFFYNVSQLERAIHMENIDIATPRTADGDVMLSVEVLATTFRRNRLGGAL